MIFLTPDIPDEISVDIPPSNCLVNEFAFINAYIEPIYINFVNVLFAEKLKENIINNIIDIKDCTNNNEITDFIQDLNIHDVDEFDNVIIINGVNSTNTFIIMYLSEYENNKLNNPNDVKLFIIPSNENTFNVVSNDIIEFIFIIKFSKLISVFIRLSPTALIDPDIKKFIFNICSHIKYEKFTQAVIINNLKTN